MKLQNLFPLIVMGLVVLPGCGGSSGGGSDNVRQPEPPVIPTVPDKEDIDDNAFESFALTDPSCNSSQALIDLGNVKVFDNTDGFLAESIEDGSGLTSVGGLSSTFVSRVIHGQKQQIDEEASYNFALQDVEEIEVVGQNTVADGESLFVCDTVDLPSRSLEAEAISTLFHLEKSAAFYDSLDTGNDVAPVLLNMFPEIRHTLTFTNSDSTNTLPNSFTYYDLDNAFYSSFGDQPEVAVLARYEGDDGVADEKALWRSPFVVAHEYGHHVFANNGLSVLSNEARNALLRHDIHSRTQVLTKQRLGKLAVIQSELFGGKTFERAKESFYTPEEGITTIQRSISSLNEGFADIFGYLANDERPDQAGAFTFLAVDRDVEKDSFANGDLKKIGYSELFDITDGGSMTKRFNDSHIVGAVLAHTFMQLLAAEEVAIEETSEKANAAIAWVQAFDAEFTRVVKDPTVQDEDVYGDYFLRMGIVAMLDSLAGSESSLTEAQCLLLNTHLPALATVGSTSVTIRHDDETIRYSCD